MLIGKTPFRNTEFIYYGLEIDNIRFQTDYPSKLGDMVVKGEIDIAPASSITYGKHPDKLLILPDISISAAGRTNSILVFSEDLPDLSDLDGKKIALPYTSASSNALIEIVLKLRDINAEFICNQKPDIERMLKKADAGLLIGDDALLAFSDGNKVLADLGEEWYKLTGRSMVYALWMVSKKAAHEKPEKVEKFLTHLTNAKKYAYENFDSVVVGLADEVSMDDKLLREHLSNLSYELGEKEINGLLKYFRYAKKFGIIDKVPKLNFFKF